MPRDVCWLLQLGLAEWLVAQLLDIASSSLLVQPCCRDADIEPDESTPTITSASLR